MACQVHAVNDNSYNVNFRLEYSETLGRIESGNGNGSAGLRH